MPDDPQKSEILKSILGTAGDIFQGVKLGPGVVGRNTSLNWACLVVLLAGVVAGVIEHKDTMIYQAIGGAIVIAIFGTSLNTYFGVQNPVAAVLEGAEFVKYYENKMGSKNKPVIDVSPPIPPPELPEQDSPPSLPENSQ